MQYEQPRLPRLQPISADAESAPGVFVCGRQHSGNTMLAILLERLPGCAAGHNEEVFFEHRLKLDKLPDASARAFLIKDLLSLKDLDLADKVALALLAWAKENPHEDAISVFQKAMALVVHHLGENFWVRKATSYIFHSEVILRRMPNVKLIYLLRNPFDLSASVKGRQQQREHTVGVGLGWNRGVGLAHRCQQLYPDRFHIVHYEKLIEHPDETVRSICKFLNQKFDPALLDVPQVNTSNNPYAVVEGKRGFSSSHLYHYMDKLSPVEVMAMQTICSSAWLRRLYPGLPHHSEKYSFPVRLKALGLVIAGFLRYPLQVYSHARNSRLPFDHYLLHRIKALFSNGDPTTKLALAGLFSIVMATMLVLSRVIHEFVSTVHGMV